MIHIIKQEIANVIARNQFLTHHKSVSTSKGKIILQGIISISFLVLSVANLFTKSYMMMAITFLGFAVNAIFALLALKTRNNAICSYSSTIFCSIIFAYFVVCGGNDGFASLWITLLPIFSMVTMDLIVGAISGVLLQIFLIVVFWTPVNNVLLYHYNDQFCLRFPMFFFVSFALGLVMSLSLQKNQYNAQMHLSELEKVTEIANRLAKYDPLTGLANRRCAYEIFDTAYCDDRMPHCIVMGDIDNFKSINDTYGHDFGDKVLVTVADCITAALPEDYLKSRWGGEEFLIAANQPIESVYEKIEQLRLQVMEHPFICNGQTVKVTITFGIAEYHQSKDLNAAINTADRRLYIGKNTTRNCTVIQ